MLMMYGFYANFSEQSCRVVEIDAMATDTQGNTAYEEHLDVLESFLLCHSITCLKSSFFFYDSIVENLKFKSCSFSIECSVDRKTDSQ